MENLLFKEIVKVVLVFVSPIVILIVMLNNEQPQVAIAFFIGVLLGVYRLKALFTYITCVLDQEKSSKNTFLLIKYMASMLLSLGVTGFALYKSPAIGLPLLFGLITIPIVVMIYAIWKGISLYRKK